MGDFQTSPDGALFELVARGKKDTFFLDNSAPQAFNHAYKPTEPHITETRFTVPKTAPAFGRPLEFELETFGDILREVTLKIDLPTWLPLLPLVEGQQPSPPQSANQALTIREQGTNYTYGWTNGIGAFLFESIELLQDKIRILELSGDALFFLQNAEGTNSQAYLRQRLIGQHAGTPADIARNATPGTLYLRLPWPAATTDKDPGFPLVAATDQVWRIRLKLRPLDALLETSNTSETQIIKADPFNKTFRYTDLNGVPITFQSISRTSLPPPTIQLLTRQSYVRDEFRKAITETHLEYPFRRFFPNVMTAGELDYAPFNTNPAATVPVMRRLEGLHPTGRLLVTFRRNQDLRVARYAQTTNTATTSVDGEFYNNMKLIIAGRDRESLWSPLVWRDLISQAHDDRYPGTHQAAFNWTVGAPTTEAPSGTVNFSTADRPNLYIELQNTRPDPQTNQRTTEILAVVESWDTYVFDKGRAYVKFFN
jgi:hypothetical protein